ncbi:MAG: hypothetical protein K0R82_505 [Flavipsychrobacter sp.]|nr:hypothetical protein [Flavipsychrobacter sp.]
MTRTFLIVCLTFLAKTMLAQSPKREFRAAWIATVSNIDWPSKPGLPASQQQQEFIRRLDQLQSVGCNAVIVQVRPASDAFYESAAEPWSRYLTGKQGLPPSPFYDPLHFMINETHKRNMEFHAWFNPYRVLTDSKKNPNPEGHVSRTHPEWLVSYGGKTQFDPGIPEVRDYVLNIILDVVKRYDIDAVHLDDYFYPYRIAGQEFGDARSYARYKANFTNKDDWRRNNVDMFISALHSRVRNAKPYVKIGISPFGVWRNASKDPEGSPTRGGQTNYDDLYADVLLWMKKGWIDYLLPQLYWEHGHKAVAFEVLLPWWEAHSYGRHMYYGLGLYRMLDATKGPWTSTKELLWQIRDIRRIAKNPGYSLYSSSNLDKIRLPIGDSLAKITAYPAFPPPMKWLDSVAPTAPVIKLVNSKTGNLLEWKKSKSDDAVCYAVYKFINDEPINLERVDRIIKVQSATGLLDFNMDDVAVVKYVVTAFDRLWNESYPSNVIEVKRRR